MNGQIVKTTQKTVMNTLPRLVVIAIIGGLIAVILGSLTGFLTGMFGDIGDIGTALIATTIALVVYSIAMGMSKSFNIVDDLESWLTLKVYRTKRKMVAPGLHCHALRNSMR